jgi:hypothetical protein
MTCHATRASDGRSRPAGMTGGAEPPTVGRMPSPEIIRQNLAVLHAAQDRRVRWLWAGLAVCAVVGAVVLYRTLF